MDVDQEQYGSGPSVRPADCQRIVEIEEYECHSSGGNESELQIDTSHNNEYNPPTAMSAGDSGYMGLSPDDEESVMPISPGASESVHMPVIDSATTARDYMVCALNDYFGHISQVEDSSESSVTGHGNMRPLSEAFLRMLRYVDITMEASR